MNVRFEVFTAVTIKNAVLWDVALRSSCVNRCFGGTSVHLHGATSQKTAFFKIMNI
jgi:hypothetical protein